MGRDHQAVACAQYGAPRVRLQRKREVAPAHGRRQRGAVRRKVMAKTIAGSCVGIILLCASIQAHHSFAAQFDPKKPTTTTGAVTKIEWANPHIYFYVDAKDAAGSLVNWAVEMGNPLSLIRLGWSRTDMRVGDVATGVGTAALPAGVIEPEPPEGAEVYAVKSAFAEAALTRAKVLGASYADIRINRYRSETIFTRERQVQNVARNQDFGFGVRVLVNGTWGFAASNILTADEIRRVTNVAVDIARPNSMFQRKG